MSSSLSDTHDLQIRPGQTTDLPAVAEVYWSAWHDTHAPFIPAEVAAFRDKRFFTERARSFGARLIVAELDGLVVGFAAWRDARLDQLWLYSDARGLGIGNRLAEAAEARIVANGTARAQLTCMAANEAARRFYEGRGWRIVKRFDKPLETAQGAAPVPCLGMEKDLAAGR